jgi:hypothetical protein
MRLLFSAKDTLHYPNKGLGLCSRPFTDIAPVFVDDAIRDCNTFDRMPACSEMHDVYAVVLISNFDLRIISAGVTGLIHSSSQFQTKFL